MNLALMDQSSQFITLLNIPLTIQFARKDPELDEWKWLIKNYSKGKEKKESCICARYV